MRTNYFIGIFWLWPCSINIHPKTSCGQSIRFKLLPFWIAATLLKADIVSMSIVGITILLLVTLFWKEFKCLASTPILLGLLAIPIIN